MAGKVRIAVAGAGAFGREHLRRLRGIDGVEIAGVADTDEAAARRAADAYGIEAWGTDAGRLITELRPDGLVVATPGRAHVPLARQALALGIPVLVEKPVALSVAEARSLQQAEAASSGSVLPGHILRFSEHHRLFASMAQSEAVGPILSVTARRHRDDSHAVRYGDIDPVLMTMIHDIDLAVWLTGAEVREVLAVRRPAGMQRSLTLMTAVDSRGCIWRLATAWTFPGEAPPDSIEVIGGNGSVELEVGSHIRRYGAAPRHVDLAGVSDDALVAELSYFVDCVRRGEAPRVVTLDDAVRGLAAAEAAIASLRTGELVRL